MEVGTARVFAKFAVIFASGLEPAPHLIGSKTDCFLYHLRFPKIEKASFELLSSGLISVATSCPGVHRGPALYAPCTRAGLAVEVARSC